MTKNVAGIPKPARISSTRSVTPGVGPLSKVSVTRLAVIWARTVQSCCETANRRAWWPKANRRQIACGKAQWRIIGPLGPNRPGLLRQPFFDFRRFDNSLGRDGIERAGTDLGADFNLARRKRLGLSLAGK